MKSTLLKSICTLAITLTACSVPVKKQITPKDPAPQTTHAQDTTLTDYEASLKLENYLVTNIPKNNSVEISQETGIFIVPDEKQIDEYIRKSGEETFYTVSDDNNFYTSEATNLLEEKGIQCIYPKVRYLRFRLENGKELLLDTKSRASRGWICILFTPGSLPKLINPVDISEEATAYFGK